MVGTIIVMEPAEYERWLRYPAEGSLALKGRQEVFKCRCNTCHSADAERTGAAPRRPLAASRFTS